ncbi:MAG: hypothetical protein ACFFD2_13295 [Promethearchaeota archaeon]
MSNYNNYKVKCLLMGDNCIDTWAYVLRFLNNSFKTKYKYLIGCDTGLIDVFIQNACVTFSIWDLNSSERFSYFRPSLFRGAQCAILVFDLARYETFNPTIMNFINEIYYILGPIPLRLIGINANKTDERQIKQETIDLLCEELPQIAYFEIGFNTEGIINVLENIAESVLNNLGHTGEYRRKINEFKRKSFRKFIYILEEIGIKINEKNMVEILTHRGFFSVSIANGRVYYESLLCKSCQRNDCHYKYQSRTKSLCIISASKGWSNEGLFEHQLLILSKIFAITEDKLPFHILNQIKKCSDCKHYIGPEKNLQLNNNIQNSEKNTSLNSVENIHEPLNIPLNQQEITLISAAEVRTLLRNYRIQFNQGQLPYSLYQILKERYEKIINQD